MAFGKALCYLGLGADQTGAGAERNHEHQNHESAYQHDVGVGRQCGICLEDKSLQFLTTTACCKQSLCRDCHASVCAYSNMRQPQCPFCRKANFTVNKLSNEATADSPRVPRPSLEGAWVVHITERSRIGTTKYAVTLNIEGGSGKYEDANNRDSHYNDGSWNELQFGHTPSGKTFVGEQFLSRSPSWLGPHYPTSGSAGLRGRLNGPNSATFCTSMTICDPRGDDELEIVQEGVMTRR